MIITEINTQCLITACKNYTLVRSSFDGGTGAGGVFKTLASSAFSSAERTYTGGAAGRNLSAFCGSL